MPLEIFQVSAVLLTIFISLSPLPILSDIHVSVCVCACVCVCEREREREREKKTLFFWLYARHKLQQHYEIVFLYRCTFQGRKGRKCVTVGTLFGQEGKA